MSHYIKILIFQAHEHNQKADRGREDENHLISVSIQFSVILHVLVVKITISFSLFFSTFAMKNLPFIYLKIIIEISHFELHPLR